ncbi:mycothiol synthase [Sanguibacter suaedae]|nr:mycothiol synthase [Sanguibacter suaedae]
MDDAQIMPLTGPLPPEDAEAVLRLARAAEHVDGVAPLSEQPLLWLRDASAPVEHLLVRAADDLAGYAQLDLGGTTSASAELVVHPFARRHGVGRALLAHVRDVADREGRELAVWAHGDVPAAQGLAAAEGYSVVRELLRMELDLTDRTLVPVDLAEGLTLRTFRPGDDDEAWVALNARAFADHPEQGRLTVADLRARTAEDWFDPEAFFLVHRGDALVGSLWVKVPTGQGDGPRTGEIYAVGIDPDAQGQGIGSALTRVALDHLARTGVGTAELYTEADNTAAVRTYTAAGFTVAATDVQYSRTS